MGGFWSSETLGARVLAKNLIVPFVQARVKHGAYELTLGGETFVTSDTDGAKKPLSEGEQVIVPAGQFGLLVTEEEIAIPNDAIGFISIKAGIKFRGLVNVSGFHVDPGFVGKLKFSVYNAGSQAIVLSRRQKVFLLWFCSLDKPTADTYNGEHARQSDISSEDVMQIQGKVHSPAVLDKRLTDLEHSITWIKAIAVPLAILAVGWFLKFLLDTPMNVSHQRPVGVERLKLDEKPPGPIPEVATTPQQSSTTFGKQSEAQKKTQPAETK